MSQDIKLMLLSALLYVIIVTAAVGFVGSARASNLPTCVHDEQITEVTNVTKDGFDIKTSDPRTHCKGE